MKYFEKGVEKAADGFDACPFCASEDLSFSIHEDIKYNRRSGFYDTIKSAKVVCNVCEVFFEFGIVKPKESIKKILNRVKEQWNTRS